MKICILSCLLPVAALGQTVEDSSYWYSQGQKSLEQSLTLDANTRTAKNVILFVGDGNGITSVTATRIFDGQSRGESGENNVLSYEHFPHVALSKTYNTNQQTADSAGTMTAIMTGVKTRAGVIAVGPEAPRGDCGDAGKYDLPTLLEQARDAGKATGVVTTTSITHATPAATYAHSVERDWEGDDAVPEEMKACARDIARQLVENGRIEIVLGGGRQYFMTTAQRDPEYGDKSGRRRDGQDLIAAWRQVNPDGQYVWNRKQFDEAGDDASGPLLGLFEPSHMAFEADRADDEPSLAEMTARAIARLKQRGSGFFLMVEGGRIDHAHHAGNAFRALSDGQAFARAVQVAADNTSAEDTLIVVTADHSHVLTMAGYPARGNPILGKVMTNDDQGEPHPAPVLAADDRPYTTLSYMNGPGYGHFGSADARYGAGMNPGRHLTVDEDTTGPDYFQESLVPIASETHGGEDVAIYARGPWAHLFHGVHEQNYLYHVMRHAFGLAGDDGNEGK